MVTIQDVAKAAGVSKSTVSMVINNNPKVKTETKYKVLSVIEKLGYVRNVSAVELTTKHKQNLGVIRFQRAELKNSFEGDPFTFYHDVANGIYRELQGSNYGLLHEEIKSTNGICQIPQMVKTNRIEGLLIIGGIFDKQFIETIREKISSVVILGVDYPDYDCVAMDSKFGTYTGIKYLIDHGHRDILFINGPEFTTSTDLKEEGYRLALAEAGIPFNEKRHMKSPFSGSGGYNAIKEVFEKDTTHPTAIFTGSDSIAAGVLRYFYEKRIMIPEDISVATFDDSILTEFGTPPLTSINMNKEQVGIEGYRMLRRRIKNPKAERKCVTVPYKIIDRGSVKKITG